MCQGREVLGEAFSRKPHFITGGPAAVSAVEAIKLPRLCQYPSQFLIYGHSPERGRGTEGVGEARRRVI